jgi:3-oxoacyl-[acyl-carrier protein] reductase
MALQSPTFLADKIAIVTGGTRGIGEGISLALASRGASIAVVYSNPGKSNIIPRYQAI